MGEYFDQIPAELKEHIEDITKTSGLEYNDESLEKMAHAWIEKKNAFEDKINELSLEELSSFTMDDARGAIVMTYSGSLLSVGPIVNDVREVEYTSVGIRTDVPASATNKSSALAEDIEVNKEVRFNRGPVKSTSLVYKIAVVKEDQSAKEQLETLNNATVALEEEFTNINKTIILE